MFSNFFFITLNIVSRIYDGDGLIIASPSFSRSSLSPAVLVLPFSLFSRSPFSPALPFLPLSPFSRSPLSPAHPFLPLTPFSRSNLSPALTFLTRCPTKTLAIHTLARPRLISTTSISTTPHLNHASSHPSSFSYLSEGKRRRQRGATPTTANHQVTNIYVFIRIYTYLQGRARSREPSAFCSCISKLRAPSQRLFLKC